MRKLPGIAQLSRGWIFVSHSNKDLRKVRFVRNVAERLGANPLLFFLRAGLPTHLLKALLFMEIDARNVFLLCNSKNARASKWVQDEVAYVKQRLAGKIYAEIDLDDPLPQQRAQVRGLLRRSTVFVSFAHADRRRVKYLLDLLRQNQFTLFQVDTAEPVRSGSAEREALQAAVMEAVFHGYFILLLSREALDSRWVRYELDVAIDVARKVEGRVIVVELEPLHNLPPAIATLQRLRFDPESPVEDGLRLLAALGLEAPSVIRPDAAFDAWEREDEQRR